MSRCWLSHAPRIPALSTEPRAPSTHNAVWGRCAPDETLHLAAVSPHSVLHRLAGDDGGPCKQETQSGSAGPAAPAPAPRPPRAAHHSRRAAPPAQLLRCGARWPGRCRCRHLPGSPTSAAAGCCYSAPGQREQPRVGSQEAWAPRSGGAPALDVLERKQEGPQVNSQKGNRVRRLAGPSPGSKRAGI